MTFFHIRITRDWSRGPHESARAYKTEAAAVMAAEYACQDNWERRLIVFTSGTKNWFCRYTKIQRKGNT